ncbi:hypothetical protein RI054_04g24770 [Pseudoscourfieldia marina]
MAPSLLRKRAPGGGNTTTPVGGVTFDHEDDDDATKTTKTTPPTPTNLMNKKKGRRDRAADADAPRGAAMWWRTLQAKAMDVLMVLIPVALAALVGVFLKKVIEHQVHKHGGFDEDGNAMYNARLLAMGAKDDGMMARFVAWIIDPWNTHKN